jgi:hypothetical protein
MRGDQVVFEEQLGRGLASQTTAVLPSSDRTQRSHSDSAVPFIDYI